MISVGICDDDPLVLSYLAATLARVDDIAVVHQCAGGHEALAAPPVDLWLMDIRMPGISGVETCRALTSRPDPPRVLLLTSLSTTSLTEAVGAGACGFLYKDTPAKALAAAIRAADAGIFVHSPGAAGGPATRGSSPEGGPRRSAARRRRPRADPRHQRRTRLRPDGRGAGHVGVRGQEAGRHPHEARGRQQPPPADGTVRLLVNAAIGVAPPG